MKTKLLKKIRKSYNIIHNKRTNTVDIVFTNFFGQKRKLQYEGGYYITSQRPLNEAIKATKQDLQIYLFNKYKDKFKKSTKINF